MKHLLFFTYAFALFLLLLGTGCNKNLTPENPPSEELGEWNVPTLVRLSSMYSDDNPGRFLGRSFDLNRYDATDEEGFSPYAVLDFKQRPWSPFGRTLEEVEEPEMAVIPIQKKVPQFYNNIILEESELRDTLAFKIGADKYISYTQRKKTYNEEKAYYCASYARVPLASVVLEYDSEESLEFFLRKRFVNDLKSKPVDYLIGKYGTHIVVGYDLGAYLRFVMAASSNAYSKEETKELEAAFWKANLSGATQQKLKKYKAHASVMYTQGGTDYIPDLQLINLETLLSPTATAHAPFSFQEWYQKINPQEKSYMPSLRKGGMIPISDLISDIPLKIKYAAGILLGKAPRIHFVFCDPETYKPVLFRGEFMTTLLTHYDSQKNTVNRKFNYNTISEKLLGVGSLDFHDWVLDLEPNGLWTCKSPFGDKYFCRDLKVRKLSEDTTGLRYWLLNPIAPDDKRFGYSLNRLFIQPLNPSYS